MTFQPCQPLDGIQDTRMPDRLTGGPQDVKDNHEEAAKVAPQALRLCELVRAWMLHTHMALPDSLQEPVSWACLDHTELLTAYVHTDFASKDLHYLP